MDSTETQSSPSSHSLRQHTHMQSPSNHRIALSASTSSTPSSHTVNGEEPIISTPVTVEEVLLTHSHAAEPARAALEAILAERNSLSAQNSQLWNHLKRQRANYASAVKDVVRLRSERDALKARLAGSDEPDVQVQQPNGRKLRPSVSSAAMSAKSSTNGTVDANGQALLNSHSVTSQPRVKMTRHHSDDTPSTPRKPSPSNERRSQTPTLTFSRSQDPVRGQERERSNTHPGVSAVDPVPGPSTPVSPQLQENIVSRHYKSPSLDIVPVTQQAVAPTPLIIPPVAVSEVQAPEQPGANGIISTTRPLQLSPKRDRPSLSEPAPQSSSNLLLPINLSSTSSSPISTSPEELHAPNSRFSSLPQQMQSASLTPNYLAPANPNRRASRESRISLPDEAKRFIANMGESPQTSPRATLPTEGWSSSQNGERTLSHVSEEESSRSDNASRPFLDLEDDSDVDPRLNEDPRTRALRGSDSEVDADGAEDAAVDFDYTPKRGALSGNQQTPKIRTTAATADQFPLPPSTYAGTGKAPTSPTSSTSVNGQANLSATDSPMTLSVYSSVAEGSQSSDKRSRDKRDSFMIPENLPAATFRQMPLLNTDVKSATVKVIGSHIRANDKGKEVLSFVVQVDVPGKEGWTIEKFYSDVLGLDSRLRTLCSRATLKKLAPLPDNKLFKDHAPAKVDQRKQILQVYLQTVMALPIKDKNEIIVFFSTDIMRERSPVTKSGYKEGYLTKRGKNFGGWKTRYFVLQGPILEYYESRGGAHLGSIHISGAQIGRQQRANEKRDAEDENEFRHAFLILERRRLPAGQSVQHVLCAESDSERDAWVEVLMRYVMGSYIEDDRLSNGGSIDLGGGSSIVQNGPGQPRTSTSSLSVNEINSTPNRRTGVSKEQIQKASAQPIPISQLAQDRVHAKFFQAAPIPDDLSSSPAKSSPIERQPGSSLPFSDRPGKTSLDKFQSANGLEDGQLSSSVPTTSNLDVASGLAPIGQRATSELGHYPDLSAHRTAQASPDQAPSRPRERVRASYYPSLATVQPSPTDRSSSPDPSTVSMNKGEGVRQVKISGPVKATPILDGQAFGGRASSEMSRPANDRERKAKSRSFWGFGRQAAEKSSVPMLQPRAVFGVPLEESLAVSQILNLPAIFFRCVQYLEAKHAEQEEGVYRLSGSNAVIKGLRERFNAEGDVDLLASDEDWDPHAIAGLLKGFLRELPASILTHDLLPRFLGVIDLMDPQERVKELQELISQLPYANYSLLRALTAHLILIVQNANVNKMTMRNVGIVFSPTLGIPAGVFSLMLSEYDSVFNVEGDGSDTPADEEEPTSSQKRLSGLSRRNSKRYSDAAVDQTLGLSGRTLPVTEEDRSDDENDMSEGETDTEGTEAETEAQTVESSVDSSRADSPAVTTPLYQEQLHPPAAEQATPKSRASNVAASRGLNINVVEGEPRRRVPGLPASPRPSPLNTPTSGPHANSSPSHTPR